MMDSVTDDKFLWVEKYRPQTIEDCILPEHLKTPFKNYVKEGRLPNLILTGTAGVGKTTVAKAMCKEIDADYIMINGSLESGIETLRIKILGFATSMSLMGGRKVVIVDEADNLTQAAQLGFRGVIEEVADHCSFIFTCNYVNRIIDAIHSRCAVINFKLNSTDKSTMAAAFYKRVLYILQEQKVKYDEKVVAEVIMKYFPDYRRVINEIQKYSTGGVIDAGILSQITDVKIDELIKHLKAKDFKSIRQWVGTNSGSDASIIMREIYDKAMNLFKGPSVAVAIVLLGKYQYQAAFVADQEINLMAFLTELLVECEFK